MAKGFIVLISGPSGVGKGTIIEKLIEDKRLNLTFSVSMTTRSARPKEVHGEHYFFVTREEFNNHVRNENFLEHATFIDNSYGTPRDHVMNMLEQGKNVLIEIEVNGAKQLISKVDEADLLSIYLMPPSVEDLISRLRNRGSEDEETIQKRAKKFMDEVKFKDQYQYNLINEDLDTCIEQVRALILAKMSDR